MESRPILISHTRINLDTRFPDTSAFYSLLEDSILYGVDTFSQTCASIDAHINASESIDDFSFDTPTLNPYLNRNRHCDFIWG